MNNSRKHTQIGKRLAAKRWIRCKCGIKVKNIRGHECRCGQTITKES